MNGSGCLPERTASKRSGSRRPGSDRHASMKVSWTASWAAYYEAGTDTLLDLLGARWVRVQGGGLPATQQPATPPAATQTSAGSPKPVSRCLDLHGGGTYQASVGSLSLTATLPTSTSWEGLRDSFFLSRFGCPRANSVSIEAQVVTHVDTDACDRAGPRLKAGTAAAAVAALAAQTGVTVVGPTDATLGGYSASRFEVGVLADFDASTCTGGVIQPLEGVTSMEPGQLHTVYLVDVEGTVLAVVTDWNLAPSDLAAQGDAILATLLIEP